MLENLPDPLPLLMPPVRPSGRVIRPLPPPQQPAPGVAPPGGTRSAIDPPLSAFWQNRNAMTVQGDRGLAGLTELNTAVGNLREGFSELVQRDGFRVTTAEGAEDALRSTRLVEAVQSMARSADAISKFTLPNQFTVTATLEAAQMAVLDRSAKALEALAETLEDCCSNAGCAPQRLSGRALSLIARLTTVQTLLADRHDVTLISILQKLVEQNRHLISRLQQELDDTVPPEAARWFADAVAAAPFDRWQKAGMADDDPHVRAELSLRVARLLAVQCAVAKHVQGDAKADEEEDGPPNEAPAELPAAAPAKQRGGRGGRRAA